MNAAQPPIRAAQPPIRAAQPLIRAALALPMALATAALLGPAAEAEAAPAKVDKRPTVAVLYFDYQGKSDELGQLRKGLAQMLVSDLSRLDALRVVERDRLQALLDELELNKTRKIDKATANRIGKLLGAKYLVLGGYFDLLGTLRVDARVVAVETGQVVKSFGASGKADDFLAIERQVAGDLEALLTSGTLKGFAAVKPSPRPPTFPSPRPTWTR